MSTISDTTTVVFSSTFFNSKLCHQCQRGPLVHCRHQAGGSGQKSRVGGDYNGALKTGLWQWSNSNRVQ